MVDTRSRTRANQAGGAGGGVPGGQGARVKQLYAEFSANLDAAQRVIQQKAARVADDNDLQMAAKVQQLSTIAVAERLIEAARNQMAIFGEN